MDTYNPNHCQQIEPIQNILYKTVIGYHIYEKIHKLPHVLPAFFNNIGFFVG